MRSVDEWVAKHDDQRVPDRVRVRIFDRYDGHCYRTGRRIAAGEAWALDHIIALANGGEHRESNLAPILTEPHKEKTRLDRKVQSRIYKIKKRHLGLKKPKGRPLMGTKASGWRKRFDGTWEKR